MGWVSPKWTLLGEVSPLIESVTGNLVAPMIERYLAGLNDEAIPGMVHKIIDDAIKNGELILFEGKIVFEREDLQQLKRLLDLNLPYDPNEEVDIKTE